MYEGQLISHKSVFNRTIKAIQDGTKKEAISDTDSSVVLKGKKKKTIKTKEVIEASKLDLG
jgi:hypothetical protein